MDTKTNEIPVAHELFKQLDLDGRKVSLAALHTLDQTAQELVLEHGADYLLTVKANQPTLRAHIEKLIPAPPRFPPPRTATATLAGRREFNKGQPEVRVLRSCPSSAEAMDFPGVQQVARLRRHLRQHSPETVALVTSLPPAELNAAQGLEDNRAAWGIESGLHPRLDVSHATINAACACPNPCGSLGCSVASATASSCTGAAGKRNPGTKPPPTPSPP